jgi:adenosylcobinamide-GDP ribazoletransferase
VKPLIVAIAFLTRLPVPGPPPADASEVGRAAPLFPVAGALLGAIAAASAHVLSLRLPSLLCASLVVALLAALTGALHLDGLADMADGFGGGRTRGDVLRIMRDHAIGTYGASALALDLITKVTAISALLAAGVAVRWLVLAAALARWTPVALACFLPYARPEGGLGATVTKHRSVGGLVVATAMAAVLAIGALGARGAIAFAAVLAFAAVHGAACRRRIGGLTGDTLGAGIEMAEALVLVLAVALGA